MKMHERDPKSYAQRQIFQVLEAMPSLAQLLFPHAYLYASRSSWADFPTFSQLKGSFYGADQVMGAELALWDGVIEGELLSGVTWTDRTLNPALMKLLLDHGAHPNEKFPPPDETPWQVALSAGNRSGVDFAEWIDLLTHLVNCGANVHVITFVKANEDISTTSLWQHRQSRNNKPKHDEKVSALYLFKKTVHEWHMCHPHGLSAPQIKECKTFERLLVERGAKARIWRCGVSHEEYNPSPEEAPFLPEDAGTAEEETPVEEAAYQFSPTSPLSLTSPSSEGDTRRRSFRTKLSTWASFHKRRWSSAG
ncbi:hypothetical protein B0T17DRAFT_501998 [Bombardia bombarda]|uniref:Uncharacterized protein n=1 Tax=Bombardia bombarda TaxID=252184 RepID=A0AA39XHX4_9PEZI|nr:hypothetical protein B0T17DRAFT_501998 [Bombardia bombarda]